MIDNYSQIIKGIVDNKLKVIVANEKSNETNYQAVKYIFEENTNLRNELEQIKQENFRLDNGWIPCSERLPKERAYEDGTPICEYNVMLKGAKVPTTGVITKLGVWGQMCWSKNKFHPFLNTVVAWQPLPEPYKGE
jgi:hypothetical protein